MPERCCQSISLIWVMATNWLQVSRLEPRVSTILENKITSLSEVPLL